MIIHYETVFTKFIFLRKRTFYKEPVSIEKMFSKTVLNIDNFFDYIYIYIYILKKVLLISGSDLSYGRVSVSKRNCKIVAKPWHCCHLMFCKKRSSATNPRTHNIEI